MDTIEYKGHMIEIIQDDSPSNPREEWDNFGTMALLHSRYNLANETHCRTPEEIMDYIAGLDCFYLPVFMYDHSGVALSTAAFGDMWDSGQIGYVFIEKSKVREEFGVKRISKRIRNIAINNLKIEVDTYGAYLNGEVYGFSISDENGEELDSVFGFYGYDSVVRYAKETVDYYVKDN